MRFRSPGREESMFVILGIWQTNYAYTLWSLQGLVASYLILNPIPSTMREASIPSGGMPQPIKPSNGNI